MRLLKVSSIILYLGIQYFLLGSGLYSQEKGEIIIRQRHEEKHEKESKKKEPEKTKVEKKQKVKYHKRNIYILYILVALSLIYLLLTFKRRGKTR